MSSGERAESNWQIVQALLINLAIAVAKGIAAALSGSGAMLAETLHSLADCGNQIVLLLGVRRAKRPPDEHHPLGHGREMYFYSFIVALLLFFGGGVFSIREGIHKIADPSPVGSITLSLVILVVSLVLEGYALVSVLREIRKRRTSRGVIRFLRDTKDSDLIVVFGEESSAVIGLTFAIAALGIAHVTGNGRWDGAGSLAIGCVLVGSATFLAREVKSLLVGEAADPSFHAIVAELATADPDIVRVLNALAIQQGPGEVMAAIKLEMRAELTTAALVEAINRFERALKVAVPEIRWSFIEPDDAD